LTVVISQPELLVSSKLDHFENYYKDNTLIIYFNTIHDNNNWKSLVYDIIENAQQIGRMWTLSGNISTQFDGITNDIKVS
jgi:hypothetical protein